MRNELEYAKILESTGLSRKEAEKYLRVIGGAIMDNVATKEDILNLKSSTSTGITSVRGEMKEEFAVVRSEMADFRTELKLDIAELKGVVSSLSDKLFIRLCGATVSLILIWPFLMKLQGYIQSFILKN